MVDYKIVIIGSEGMNPNVIKNLISDDFTQCIAAFNYQDALDAMSDIAPCIIVFYSESLSAAETYYLKLYRSTDGLKRFPHKTVALCRLEESKQAYELCREYVFDDYLSANPVHDAYRLKLCLYQAIKLLAMEEKIKRSSDLSITWLNQANEYEKIAEDNISMSNKLAGDIASERNTASSEIINNISSLAAGFGKDKYNKNITVNNPKEFHPRFNNDTRLLVETAMNKSYDRVANRIDTIKEKHSVEFSRIQKNRKKIDKKASNSINQLIMVADNDEEFINYTTRILKESNYRVVVSRSSQETLEKSMKELPALILLEENLQGLGRDNTVRMINIMHKKRPPAIVIITENTTRQVVAEVINMGATEVIKKPFNTIALLEKIESILFK